MLTTYSFHRKIWEKDYFSDKTKNNWLCSKCGIGQLTIKMDDKNPLRNNNSEVFACLLSCTNSECKTVYATAGSRAKTDFMGRKMFIGYQGPGAERRYYPKSISPTLEFFKVPETVPNEVQTKLIDAFNLFWASAPACANAIRKSVETLLKEKGFTNKILSVNIDKYSIQDPENGKLLKAVKFIGNAGSHDDELTREDVLDGFEILSEILSIFYPDNSTKNRITQMADDINSTKKPRSSKK